MEKKRCPGCMKEKTQTPVCEHCGYNENVPNYPHQLAVGTVLRGQYTVGKVLGQGGFGITYIGWDESLESPVAIKEFYPNSFVTRDSASSSLVNCISRNAEALYTDNRERFLREARVLAKLQNVPGIVRVHNLFTENNTAYIVMEYVEGIDLKHYIRSRNRLLTVEEAFSVLRPVMYALSKVHDAELVHRDISPDNIMIQTDGTAKLLDFGAAREVENAEVDKDLPQSTEAILKHGFAPIEQYRRRGSLGPWTDVYALCATLYYCLTGKVPNSAPERIMGDDNVNWRQIPGLTEQQIQTLEKGLALMPENRVRTMRELHNGLFGQTTTGFTQGKKEEPKPEPKKKPEKKAEKKLDYPTHTVSLEEKPEKQQKTKKKSKLPLILAGCAAIAAVAGFALFRPTPEVVGEAVEDVLAPVLNIEKGDCGDTLTWKLEEGTLTIEGEGAMWDYLETDAPWLAFADEIQNITIGDTVQTISAGAFENLSNLKTLQLGAAVTGIGENAFRGTALTEITIPDNVKTIGPRAFMDTPLKTATLGAGIESVGTQAFGLCPDLESVEFTSNPILLEHWDERIFTADEDRNAPANLTVTAPYGGYAWAYAAHRDINWEESGTLPVIESGTCGDQLTWTLYEGGVFVLDGKGHMEDYWHTSYTTKTVMNTPWKHLDGQIRLLYIGEYVTSICTNAFSGMQSLQYLYCDIFAGEYEDRYRGVQTIRRLGERAFSNTGLIQLETPEYDSYYYFSGCTQLEFVKFGKGNIYLSGGSFYGCSNLQVLRLASNMDLPINQDEFGRSIFSGETWTKDAIPRNLTVYAMPGSRMEAFCKENNINFVAQSDDYDADLIGRCGDNAAWLLDREKKTLVIYGEELQAYSSNEWGRTWDFDTTQPEFYAYRDEIEHIVINSNVRYLGNSLFQGLTKVKDVGGEAYWELGNRVFYGCTSLERIELQWIYSGSFGMEIFMNCTSLKEFVCSGGNGRLKAGTFAGCTALESVYFYNYTSFEDGIFDPIDRTDKIDHDYTQHVTFYVFKGSGAEAQAKKNGIPYAYIET